jgi:hypothetical protein
MKSLLSLITALLLSTICYAQLPDQDLSKTDFEDETIYRLNVLSPSFEVEKDVSKNISIVGNIGVGISINGSSVRGKSETDFLFPVFLKASARHYTNFNRRIEKGRNIKYNSGNFVGINLIKNFGATGDISRVDSQSTITATYGLQRTYRDFLNFTFEAGPSYDFENTKSNSAIVFYLGVQIGFTL